MGGGPALARTTLRGSTAQRGARESGGEPADRGGGPRRRHHADLGARLRQQRRRPPGGGPSSRALITTPPSAAPGRTVRCGRGSRGPLRRRAQRPRGVPAARGPIIRRYDASRAPWTEVTSPRRPTRASSARSTGSTSRARFESMRAPCEGVLLDESARRTGLTLRRRQDRAAEGDAERLRTELGREPSDGEIATGARHGRLPADLRDRTAGTWGSATSTGSWARTARPKSAARRGPRPGRRGPRREPLAR